MEKEIARERDAERDRQKDRQRKRGRETSFKMMNYIPQKYFFDCLTKRPLSNPDLPLHPRPPRPLYSCLFLRKRRTDWSQAFRRERSGKKLILLLCLNFDFFEKYTSKLHLYFIVSIILLNFNAPFIYWVVLIPWPRDTYALYS